MLIISTYNGVFPLAETETDARTDTDTVQKCSTGTDPDGNSCDDSNVKTTLSVPILVSNGYSTHWHRSLYMDRSRYRFSGNSSAHYY